MTYHNSNQFCSPELCVFAGGARLLALNRSSRTFSAVAIHRPVALDADPPVSHLIDFNVEGSATGFGIYPHTIAIGGTLARKPRFELPGAYEAVNRAYLVTAPTAPEACNQFQPTIKANVWRREQYYWLYSK